VFAVERASGVVVASVLDAMFSPSSPTPVDEPPK
jgi:hypothetical protein